MEEKATEGENVCSVVRAAATKVSSQLTAVTTVGTHHYNREPIRKRDSIGGRRDANIVRPATAKQECSRRLLITRL